MADPQCSVRPQLAIREVQVAIAIGAGKNYQEIADGLDIPFETVRSYVANLRKKTSLRRKAQLACWATRQTAWLVKQINLHARTPAGRAERAALK